MTEPEVKITDPDNPDDNLYSVPQVAIYSVAQVAQTFDVTAYTVRLWIKSGKLPSIRTRTNRLYVQHADLIDFANGKYGTKK